MTTLKQALNEMRSQPVIGAVTLAGTAFAIFLIMIVVMINNVKIAPIGPESGRNRMLHEKHMDFRKLNGENRGSGDIGYKMARELYGDLESAEATAVYQSGTSRGSVRVAGQPPIRIDIRTTDDEYWRVFDHTFLSGLPFTPQDIENSSPVAIISEDVARRLFGTTDVVGREIIVNLFTRLTVAGVVRDVPTITGNAYASLWMPHSHNIINQDTYFDGMKATILARDKSDFPAIFAETERRKEMVNSRLKAEGIKIANHIVPLTQEESLLARWSNIGPDIESHRKQQLMVYLIMLLIPAINLSSMTQSRLRRRVSEMGVRRAFGCTRLRLINSIITENFLITLAGGLIGLVLSVAFAGLLADTLFVNHEVINTDTHVDITMLLNWHTFLFAMIFCFLLNLISSGLPAWRAARVNPVRAIGGLQK